MMELGKPKKRGYNVRACGSALWDLENYLELVERNPELINKVMGSSEFKMVKNACTPDISMAVESSLAALIERAKDFGLDSPEAQAALISAESFVRGLAKGLSSFDDFIGRPLL